MSSTIPVCVSLPPDLIARIDSAAAADDRSRSAVVRRILAEALSGHVALQREAARRFLAMKSQDSTQ